LQLQGVGKSQALRIDEIAVKKGHSDFETVIYTENEVLDTMTGKKSVDLQEVLKNIPGIGSITEVCIDMCASFAEAIRKALPKAEIVTDRFHLIKLLNKKLEELRKKTHKELKKAKKEKRFASIRFLLFKDYRELGKDEKRLVRDYSIFSI
jgi:transposase